MGMPPCDHCKKTFCIPHRMPEGHGCGVSAAASAQLKASAEAQAQRRARDAAGHGDAKAKLDAKRAELADARAKKPTAKQAKKK